MYFSLFYIGMYYNTLTLLLSIFSYLLPLLLFIKNCDEFCIMGLYPSM